MSTLVAYRAGYFGKGGTSTLSLATILESLLRPQSYAPPSTIDSLIFLHAKRSNAYFIPCTWYHGELIPVQYVVRAEPQLCVERLMFKGPHPNQALHDAGTDICKPINKPQVVRSTTTVAEPQLCVERLMFKGPHPNQALHDAGTDIYKPIYKATSGAQHYNGTTGEHMVQ